MTDCRCPEPHPEGQHFAENTRLFDQSKIWVDREHRVHRIELMNESYCRSVMDFLLLRYRTAEFWYGVERALHLAHFVSTSGEQAGLAAEREEDELDQWREEDPERWLRSTVLFRALEGRTRRDEEEAPASDLGG